MLGIGLVVCAVVAILLLRMEHPDRDSRRAAKIGLLGGETPREAPPRRSFALPRKGSRA